MNKKRITDVALAGFADSSAQPGEVMRVQIKGWATSDSPIFYVYAEQIGALLSSQLGFPLFRDSVNRYLLVIHGDYTADVYWDDFDITLKVRAARSIAAGQFVGSGDIDDIAEVRFPGVEIGPKDKVVFLSRSGWRFGIFYDLTGESGPDEIAVSIAHLEKELILKDVLKRTLDEIKSKETAAQQGLALEYDAFVITEGKTDCMHVAKALDSLGYDKRLEYSRPPTELGDSNLMQICRMAQYGPNHRSPVICLFDRDNPAIVQQLLKQGGGGPTDYQAWGNNVFSAMLPIPAFRMGYESINIEMYYPDDVLNRTTSDGKRLVFDNEVKIEILPGRKKRVVLVPPDVTLEKTKKVYATDAGEIEDASGRKVAISKTVFATMISEGTPPFEAVPFDAFRSLTAVLDEIIAKA